MGLLNLYFYQPYNFYFCPLGILPAACKTPDERFHRERVTDVTAFPAILAKPPGLGVI